MSTHPLRREPGSLQSLKPANKLSVSAGRRILIPVNPKTLGDHLLLKRIKANLSQPEVAVKAGVSTRTVRKWEHGLACPTEDHWQALVGILRLDSTFPKT